MVPVLACPGDSRSLAMSSQRSSQYRHARFLRQSPAPPPSRGCRCATVARGLCRLRAQGSGIKVLSPNPNTGIWICLACL
jgi:hypothetical protein